MNDVLAAKAVDLTAKLDAAQARVEADVEAARADYIANLGDGPFTAEDIVDAQERAVGETLHVVKEMLAGALMGFDRSDPKYSKDFRSGYSAAALTVIGALDPRGLVQVLAGGAGEAGEVGEE